MPPIFRRSVQIGIRIDLLGDAAASFEQSGFVQNLTLQKLFRCEGPDRRRTGTRHGQARPRAFPLRIRLENRRDASEGKVTVPRREFLEGPTHLRRQGWKDNFSTNLIGLYRCGEVRDKQVSPGNRPGAARTEDANFAIERGQNRGQLSRWVGVNNTAADGAAGPDRRVPDEPHRFLEKTIFLTHQRGFFHTALPRGGADAKRAALRGDVGEAGDAVDVNQAFGPDQAEVHHWNKTLPAREDFRLLSILPEN